MDTPILNDLTEFKLNDLLEMEHPETLLERLEPFNRLMMMYTCASMEIETKLKVLNAEFSLHHNRNPFESIKTRIKTPGSILEKTKRKNIPFTLQGLEENMFDIAGVRVICSFPEDIYTVRDMLLKQDDIRLCEEKDYIKHPKPNGYRSLHLVIETPVYLSDRKELVNVEVQIRTIAMDFWASLEHELKYKTDTEVSADLAQQLKTCAETIAATDKQMQEIYRTLKQIN